MAGRGWWVAALLLVACAPATEGPGPASSADEAAAASPVSEEPLPAPAAGAAPDPAPEETPMPAMLPTPYTAKQIQDAMPAGTQVVTRHEGPDGVTVATWSVLSNGDEGLVMETSSRSEDGAVLEAPTTSGPAPWEALRTHAQFPVDGTTRTREEVTVPFGTFPATKYVVRSAEGAGARTFWFADAIPGPPVRMIVEVDGAQAFEATMIERTGFGE